MIQVTIIKNIEVLLNNTIKAGIVQDISIQIREYMNIVNFDNAWTVSWNIRYNRRNTVIEKKAIWLPYTAETNIRTKSSLGYKNLNNNTIIDAIAEQKNIWDNQNNQEFIFRFVLMYFTMHKISKHTHMNIMIISTPIANDANEFVDIVSRSTAKRFLCEQKYFSRFVMPYPSIL